MKPMRSRFHLRHQWDEGWYHDSTIAKLFSKLNIGL